MHSLPNSYPEILFPGPNNLEIREGPTGKFNINIHICTMFWNESSDLPNGAYDVVLTCQCSQMYLGNTCIPRLDRYRELELGKCEKAGISIELTHISQSEITITVIQSQIPILFHAAM